MATGKNSPQRFAICIHASPNDMVTPRMLYKVLPDSVAERGELIRVIDDEGEDYLYPEKNFILIDCPPGIKRSLLEAFGKEASGQTSPRKKLQAR